MKMTKEEKTIPEMLTPVEKRMVDNYRERKEKEEQALRNKEEKGYWIEKAVQYYVDNYDGKLAIICSPQCIIRKAKVPDVFYVGTLNFDERKMKQCFYERKTVYDADTIDPMWCIWFADVEKQEPYGNIMERGGLETMPFPFNYFYNPFIPDDYKWDDAFPLATPNHPVINAKLLGLAEFDEVENEMEKYMQEQKHCLKFFTDKMLPTIYSR